MQKILSVRPDIDAVFAVDDYAAIGASRRAHDQGRVAGRDYALVGYNDTPIAAELDVALSSVSHSTFELGQRSLRSLISVIHGDPPQNVGIPPSLIGRASSTSPRARESPTSHSGMPPRSPMPRRSASHTIGARQCRRSRFTLAGGGARLDLAPPSCRPDWCEGRR